LPNSGKRAADHKNQAVNLHKKGGTNVQRKKTFLVVWISILTISLQGQIPATRLLINSGLTLSQPTGQTVSLLHPVNISEAFDMRGWMALSQKQAYFFLLPESILSKEYGGEYYSRNLGFFCKRELEWEKTTRIPLRFRLGSLEECNRLEGK
jgi:hypothetical protein